MTDELAIRIRALRKDFEDTTALESFDLDVWGGTLVSLLGPSGCGKTTALRAIAGFVDPDGGTIEISGREVFGPGGSVPPERRRVGMVFQEYALFPHLDVGQNVGFGLSRTDRRSSRVAEVLELVGLSDVAHRHPHELSGGQQQRVALARALAPRPEVILLDEPFSNLDAALRDRVRRDLKEILAAARATAVFVTHDQEEALAMSDMVAVMREGTVMQAAPPDILYRRPLDPWIAEFVGDADFMEGEATGHIVTTPVGSFSTELEGRVQIMIRPEAVRVEADPASDDRVVSREYFGHDQLLTIRMANGTMVRSRMGPWPVLDPGDAVSICVDEVLSFPLERRTDSPSPLRTS